MIFKAVQGEFWVLSVVCYSANSCSALIKNISNTVRQLVLVRSTSLTAVIIDEEVIKACRMYLRGACGDSLDQMQGSNYQVTCRPYLLYFVTINSSFCLLSCHWRSFLVLILLLCVTPFFIPSTSLCSLSCWLTSSYAYHIITVITFVLTICHSLDLSLQT